MGGYGISLLHLSYFYYLYLSLLAKMRAVEQRNNLISAPKPQQEIFLIYLKLSYEIISVVFIKLFKISFPKPHPLSRKLYNQELLSFTQMLGDSLFPSRDFQTIEIQHMLDSITISALVLRGKATHSIQHSGSIYHVYFMVI